MDKNEMITDEQIKYSIDLLVSMVADELAIQLHIDPKEALYRFIESETGQLLYQKDSRFWWFGPSDLADMYKKEMARKEKPVRASIRRKLSSSSPSREEVRSHR